MYEDEELHDLDDSWLVEFENIDNDYKYFYKENINSVKIHCLYINKNNCLEKIKEETILLNKSNVLSKEEIIEILKRNNKENHIRYSLMHILKYNIDLEPIHLKSFLKNNIENNTVKMDYLTTIKTLDNILFQPTIYMFQDLTDIFILFYEPNNKTITKKIFIKPNTNTKSKSKTKHKRV